MTSALDRFAARLRRIEREQLAAKSPQLANSSIEDGALRVNAADGTETMVIGKQFDGTQVAATLVGPTPPTPRFPAVLDRPGGVKVYWNGVFEPETDVAPLDFTGVDVAVGTSADFDAIATPPTTRFVSPRGGETFIALDPGTYWFALVTRSAAGKASEPSVFTQGEALAAATGAGGATIYRTDVPPVGLDSGDTGIWYDTNDGNKPYFWDGDSWESVQDSSIAQKARTFNQEAEPAATGFGDLWIKPSEGNLIRRWDGADWVPLTVGPGALGTGAILERHVAKGEVSPDSMQVSMLGGSFSNLVHDPGFKDDFFRTKRLAAAPAAGQFSFKQNVNLFSSTAFERGGGFTAGSGVTITDWGTLEAPGPVTIGQAIFTGDRDIAGLVAGKTYTFSGPVAWQQDPNQLEVYGNTPQYFEYRVQFYNATHTLIGSQAVTAEFKAVEYDTYKPVSVSLVAPAGATGMRVACHYKSGPNNYAATVSGTHRYWLVFTTGSGVRRHLEYRLSNVGSEIAPGEWYAESHRTDLAGGAIPQSQKMPVAEFPVTPKMILSASCHIQTEGAGGVSGPGGDVKIDFYDATGWPVAAYGQWVGWRDTVHPEWSFKATRYRVPEGAVTAVASISSDSGSAAGYFRLRYPQVSVAGWYDAASGQQAYIGPDEMAWQVDFTTTGAGAIDLFRLLPDFETGGADVFTEATFWHKGDVFFQGNVDFTDAFVSLTLEQLTDVDDVAPTDGQTLVYNAASGLWKSKTPAAVSLTLEQLTDVDDAAPTDGQTLVYNAASGLWKPAAPAAPAVPAVPPYLIARGPGTAQSTPNGWNIVDIASVEAVSGTGATDPTLTASTDSILINKDGLYSLTAFFAWSNTVGTNARRMCQIETYTGAAPAAGSGTNQVRHEHAAVTNVFPSHAVSTEAFLTAGTRVRVAAYQGSGAALDIRHDLVNAKLTVRRIL